MAGYIDHAYAVTSELAQVPWWCWLALLTMVFVRLLAPLADRAGDRKPTRPGMPPNG
jgi:hypothetical protein